MPVLIPFTVYFVAILIVLKNEDMLSHTHKLWHNKRPHLQSPMTYMCYKVQYVTFSTSFSAKVLMTQKIRNTNIHSTHSYTPHCVVIMAENLVWWITCVTCRISQISRSQNFLPHWAVHYHHVGLITGLRYTQLLLVATVYLGGWTIHPHKATLNSSSSTNLNFLACSTKCSTVM